jgi:hypothetical protein
MRKGCVQFKMSSAKEILKIVPLIQSKMLLDENLKLYKKKNKNSKDFIGTSIKNIIGTEFIKLESNSIGSMI